MAAEPSPPTFPPGLLDRLRSTLATVRSGRFGPPEGPSDAPAAADEPQPAVALGPPAPAEAPAAVILVTVFGLSTAALEEVLDTVSREGSETPVRPVFLTDSLDFEPFLARRLRFEYLPAGGRQHRFAPDLDWRAYERRRYRLLVEKWRPQSLISFGTPPPPDGAAALEPPA